MDNIIILRSVYGKVGQIYYIQPCPDPKTGKLPTCVKTVDTNGDMILSEKEIEARNKGLVHYVPANWVFEIQDGDRFDLDDVVSKANWEAIEHCNWIAKDRYERNEAGELVIDGGALRYGGADLYVERPGKIVEAKINKKTLVWRAESYVHQDSDSERRKKCRVLGRNLDTARPADVLDFLLERASLKPNDIINLYEGEEWKMRLFILDAVERGVITRAGGVFRYGDNILGANEDGVIAFFKDIRYRKIYDAVKQQTYPNLMPKAHIAELEKTANDGIPYFDKSSESAEELEDTLTTVSTSKTKAQKKVIG